MLSADDTEILRDWSEQVRLADEARTTNMLGRDKAIRAVASGEDRAGVAEIVKATGLTRARVYQILAPQ